MAIKKPLLQLAGVGFVAMLIAVLVTLTESGDPQQVDCRQRGIAAAVLADGEQDQDALVNRAIIAGGDCD